MKKIISIALSILVVLMSVVMLTSCSDSIANKGDKVDKSIENVVKQEDFDTLEESQKVQKIDEILKSLEADGYIAENTIVYDENTKVFSFEYADGTLGGVSLKEFNSEYNAGSIASFDVPTDAAEQTDSSQDNENTAIILNAFEDKPFRRDYYVELEKDWDAKGLSTDVDTDVTIDDLKGLSSYDVVVFAMHGYFYNNRPVLCINQTVNSQTDETYETEIKNKLVAKVLCSNWEYQYWVFPQFFTYQYSDDEWESDLVFSESCMFYGDDSVDTTPDYSFAESFVEISKGAVIGYHNSVLADYSRNVMKATVDNALTGKTIDTSLKTATTIYGETDECLDESDGKYIAYPIICGENNVRLVELTVSDFAVSSDMVITLGELGVIEPEITPVDATNYSIKWSSSDETVATVSPTGEAGVITTHSKGVTTITAELTSGGNTITKSTSLRVASKARDTVLVLDVSGSMYGDPLDEMKKSAIQFCNDLLKDEYNNRVGIVFYDDEIITIGLTDDLDMLISRIQTIDSGGLTNMEAGLAAADKMLASGSSDSTIKNVVIMADGLPNEGKISDSGSMPQGSYSGYLTDVSYANAVIDTARQMMPDYNMYSLGFFHGLDGESKNFGVALMQELTNKSDGYYLVDKAEDLQFAFGDISDEIKVASKIVINIACPVDVTVSYGGEKLSSAQDGYCDVASFGTLQLLGKNKDIKVVSLDSDKEYEIEITGTGEGKMDYSVNYYDEKEQLTDYRSFESVPITMTTVIKSDTNNTTKDIELNIDEDGDGETDIVWTAMAKSKGEITKQTNPPEPEETVSLDIEEQDDKGNDSLSQTVEVAAGIIAFILISGGIITVVLVAQSDNKKELQYEIPVINRENNVKPITLECSNCGAVQDKTDNSTDKVLCNRCNSIISEGKDKSRCDYNTEKVDISTGVIQITNGSLNGFSVPIKDGETLYLGKDPKHSNLVFTSDYKSVSRMHCSVTFDAKANKYYVIDNSLNGTYLVNKERLIKGKRTPVSINTVLLLANDECTVLLR